MKFAQVMFCIFLVLASYTLGYDHGLQQTKIVVKEICFKEAYPNNVNTWHRTKCPFNGTK